MSNNQKKKQPMTPLDYIKNQPHMQGKPLTNQNTYSALADFPPLSYAKAVDETPASSSQTPNEKPQEPTQKSAYFVKPQKHHIQTTQYFQPIKLKELQTFTNRVFQEDCLYPNDNPIKNRTFYEYILVDSKSAEITHYPDKTNPNKIAYSTCKILRIQSFQDLGFLSLHTTRNFSKPGYHIQGYSYMDYQNAFQRAFYLRPFDHSWFISFDNNCPRTCPGWFYEWWYWFGPADKIYPENLLKTSFPFYQKHLPKHYNGLQSRIAFHIDMGIPWICSWNFNLICYMAYVPDMPLCLIKEYRIKWWDKYNLDRCSLANISNYFNIIHKTQTLVKTVSKQVPLLTPSQLASSSQLIRQFGQHPSPTTQQPTPTQPQPRQPSPCNSSGSSGSQKNNKKSKIQEALLNLARDLGTLDDDEDEAMPATDQEHQDHPDPYGGPLAQDPNDDQPDFYILE